MNRSGFSFVELIVVLALISLIALLAVGGASWHTHNLVRFELDRLYYALIACSQQALCEGRTYHLIFSDTTGWRTPTTTHTFADGVLCGAPSTAFGPPATPVRLIKDPISYSGHRITCYPDGTLQPGTVYLTDKNESCSYALSSPVGSISYVRRYRYAHNQWTLVP